MGKSILKPNELAKLLNVSVKTLQRWDNEGILKAYRSPTERRYYTYAQYLEYIGVSSNKEESKGKVVIYTRVSNRRQKDDLINQVEFLKQYANAKGIIVDTIYEDIGSGLNYNRKKWNDLIEECRKNKISLILISHKDRFIRFGYSWFERFLKSCGTEIIVVNNEKLSPEQELFQDLISITHVFSCRIYGLRKYKNKIKKEQKKIVKSL